VQDFSKIMALLTKLTRKGENYVWTDKFASAFEKLKNKLIIAQILKTHIGTVGMVTTVTHPGKVWDVY